MSWPLQMNESSDQIRSDQTDRENMDRFHRVRKEVCQDRWKYNVVTVVQNSQKNIITNFTTWINGQNPV